MLTEFKVKCWMALYWADLAIALTGAAIYMMRWPITIGLIAYMAFFR